MQKKGTILAFAVCMLLLLTGGLQAQFASGWQKTNTIGTADVDSIFASDASGNSRTVIGGFDLDKDGKKELILTDYAGFTVRLFEYDDVADAFELVWTAPLDTAEGVNRAPSRNPRTVGISDFDGDDKWEIIYPLASEPSGWYVYEWDGVTGSDNFGTIYSSLITTEVDTCCAADYKKFIAWHDRVTIIDIDGDGKQEFVSMIRNNAAGGKRGTLISSVDGDIQFEGGGNGFETWSVEYFLDRINYGGGSPLSSLPADVDGDGTLELINHTWNNFNFYMIDVTGADSYAAADPASPKRFFKATADDEFSIFGGDAHDMDGDGDEEAYFPSWDTGDLWVVNYSSGDNVLDIDETNVVNIASGVGSFHASIFDVDKDGKPNIFVGSGLGNVISNVEFTGQDVTNPADYTETLVYGGEPDIIRDIVRSDSLGIIDSTWSNNAAFATKVQAHWNKNAIDFDNDGYNELLVSFQGNHDSTTTTHRTWNGAKWDTTYSKVVNPKSWALMRIEFTGTTGVQSQGVNFITPDDYVLEQNYPNPFNPSTKIVYSLPLKKKVSVKIYNMVGQLVHTLVDNQVQEAGSHSLVWDGRNSSGVRVSSGIYLYSLEFGNFKKTRQMTLLK